MSSIILFNKPFRVLCRFTDQEGRKTLADYLPFPGIYPTGRLDYDSEGLLLLTDDGQLQQHITDPRHRTAKTYLAQVEGIPDEKVLNQLRGGVRLKDGWTRPARVELVLPPDIWERVPPIRCRPNVPVTWLRLTITEGRNRQVRRMTAAVGHPTLRLVRTEIGPWSLGTLQPGQWKIVSKFIRKKQ